MIDDVRPTTDDEGRHWRQALAVAMAANQAESDPELAAALSVLAARVSTLRAQAGEAEAA